MNYSAGEILAVCLAGLLAIGIPLSCTRHEARGNYVPLAQRAPKPKALESEEAPGGMYNVRHDGHVFIVWSGYVLHHPDCPCRKAVEE